MKSIQIFGGKGIPSSLYLDESSSSPIPTISEDEILVRVIYAGINRADTLQRAGFYPPPPGDSNILGLEISGIVHQVPEKSDPNSKEFHVGQHVIALVGGGAYAEYCVVKKNLCAVLPEGVSFEKGAAIPENFLTAYQALHLIGKLKENETILIHAGGSGVGIAAIQLSKLISGVSVITTAGSSSKLSKCKKIGADQGINYKEEDFSEKVLSLTNNKGVDLLLDFVGSSYFQKNMDSLGLDGRMVIIGLLSGPMITEPLNIGGILRKRLSIHGTTLRNRPLNYKYNLFNEFEKNCLHLFSPNYNRLSVILDSSYDWKETASAHERMENNLNFGKIVIKVGSE